MASDDPMTFQFHSSSLQGSNFENDINDHHHQEDDPHPHSLSRLSVCTNSTLCGVDDEDDDDDVDYGMARYMSGLSIESFEGDGDGDGDADGELSDGREVPAAGTGLFSDSENELSSRYPLPATPPLRRNLSLTPIAAVKEYASDNEGKRGSVLTRQEAKENENDTWRKKCRRMRKERESKYWEKNSRIGSKKKEEEEVGELELEIINPSRLSVSLSNSAIETSSGATSPIANWRISSPGDDPRDVKARLKMWAQAVAASASKYGT